MEDKELSRIKNYWIGMAVRLKPGSRPMHVFDIYKDGYWSKEGPGPLKQVIDENQPIYWAKCMYLDDKDEFNVTVSPLANLVLEPNQERPEPADGSYVFVPKGFVSHLIPAWNATGSGFTAIPYVTYTKTSTSGLGLWTGSLSTSGSAIKVTTTSTTN